MSDGDAPRLADYRFPRSLRLKSPWAIRQIFREGVRRRGHGYAVYGIPSAQPSRLGIVVSNRFGRGAKRNRLRRRLREAARLSRTHWPDHMDLVVRATDGSPINMDFSELVSDLARTFDKLTRAGQ